MQEVYEKIIAFIRDAGSVLVARQREIVDIGATKQWLTEEDLRIERGLKKIIIASHPTHTLFAEEENDAFPDADDVWVADPISGTRSYLHQTPRYSIAVAHMHRGLVQFAAVYHPPTKELYSAYRGNGATMNGQKIYVTSGHDERPHYLFQKTFTRRHDEWGMATLAQMRVRGDVELADGSTAMYACHVARGDYDGMILYSKDAFPSIVTSLIIEEAGGICTNSDGKSPIGSTDRIIVLGTPTMHQRLLDAIA